MTKNPFQEKTRNLKSKLGSRQATFGAWLTLGHPAIAEILASPETCEWVVIDNEHSMIPLDMIQTLFAVVEGKGKPALVRLSHNNASEIRKFMDAGAAGVICPMVNSSDDAKAVVQAVKYPPQGQRTFGLSRAQGFGLGFDPYLASANQSSVVIAQVEHIEGVRNIDAILEVAGLDGVLIGPYDLSGSLGLPGQLQHPDVLRAESKVLAACKGKGISCGIHQVHPDPALIRSKLAMGYTWLAVGVDIVHLSGSVDSTWRALEGVQ